jgi:hypothetical protein
VDPVTAAALLGWKDPKVLLKRYVHPEKLNDVAEKVFGLGDRKVTRLRKVSDRD